MLMSLLETSQACNGTNAFASLFCLSTPGMVRLQLMPFRPQKHTQKLVSSRARVIGPSVRL
ncbi:uncharacterized protein BDZ83DRAFT_597975 [Colletotrichum acutatum]|uniref:Uncharacterized protein n=1 Tax=Glomerella acutata TaxID=27357 RepID=A0AAD9D3J8_GLOAC|nr:uncharacterized protein BDZ83DRAFT_597975 [Colletotrichum acutatum]KAK1731576.1 hypothetical protein BDZ83DRAFT_597975 [Colletotrichum acutatum]